MTTRSNVVIDVNGAGFGSVHVDGAQIKCVRSVSTEACANEATVVTLTLAIPESLKLRYEGADLIIGGIVMPDSVEIAMWRFLSAKYGRREIDATTISSCAREWLARDA